jgi:hypothetical protein
LNWLGVASHRHHGDRCALLMIGGEFDLSRRHDRRHRHRHRLDVAPS